MGMGFVGAVMAAIVADTKNKDGKYSKFVIGLPTAESEKLLEDPPVNEGIGLL